MKWIELRGINQAQKGQVVCEHIHTEIRYQGSQELNGGSRDNRGGREARMVKVDHGVLGYY